MEDKTFDMLEESCGSEDGRMSLWLGTGDEEVDLVLELNLLTEEFN